MPSLPTIFLVVRLLVRDTLRQSLASRLFWLLLGTSGLCILLCLSVGVEGHTAVRPEGEIELFGGDRQPFTGLNGGQGRLTFAFGLVRLKMPRDAAGAVEFLHALLVLTAAGFGTLLLLLWSSGFLPEFLDHSSVAVLLAKPVPRWALLVGKFLGVLLFAALQLLLFVGGTWLALGIKTGVWRPGPLVAFPFLVLLFAILYSFSTLAAVWTRSGVACVLASLAFWAVCSGFNEAHLAAPGRPAVEAAYWLLPKPGDCVVLLGEVMHADAHFRFPGAGGPAVVHAELSVFTSLLFIAGLLFLAGRRFAQQDY